MTCLEGLRSLIAPSEHLMFVKFNVNKHEDFWKHVLSTDVLLKSTFGEKTNTACQHTNFISAVKLNEQSDDLLPFYSQRSWHLAVI